VHAQVDGEAAADDPASAPLPANPFAGFHSFRLANGLKVWYGHLQGATLTSMAVIVPFGRDQDPAGREQTAHLLEHVLLSDRHGRTEAELARELTARGGGHNGVTGSRYTFYPLNIGTDQAAWGVRWLYDVVAPRLLHDELVDRNREPVAIELSARRTGLLSGAVRTYITHPRLLPEPFWKREFGIDAQEERGADPHVALGSITAADLQRYFDTYYAPSEMTLVVVSGAPWAELHATVEATFGSLPWRPAPAQTDKVRLRTSETRLFQYRAGRSTRVVMRYRIAGLDGIDQLRLAFMEDLLRHRLMERLRRGNDKSVYSIGTATTLRGPVAYFGIHADLNPRQEGVVRTILDHELERLAGATSDTLAFYADRDALSRRIRVENASPSALRAWATDRFYRPDLHRDFPDVAAYYATVGPDSIAALAGRLFRADNRILYVWRPLPLPAAVLAAAGLLVVLLAAWLYRTLTLRPADMRRVRFVARSRPPMLARAVGSAATVALVLVIGRIVVAGIHHAGQYRLLAFESFAVPAAAGALLLFAAALAALAAVGRLHRKVLVFEHELRIKSPTYRATIVPLDRVRDARTVTTTAGLRLRHFVLPPLGRAVHVLLDDGSGYVLRVRDPAALAAAVLERLPATATAAAASDADGLVPDTMPPTLSTGV
jgi:predicted Zn-dependent peptidase